AVGNKRTVWQDGVVRFDNADRSGYVFRPGENGAYTEHHWGLKPQDNYDLRHTADGRYEVADAGKDNFKELPADANDPRLERAKLRDASDALISDPKERAKFEAEMARFETRNKDLQQMYEKQGLNPEEAARKAQKEITDAYRTIRKLMETPDGP